MSLCNAGDSRATRIRVAHSTHHQRFLGAGGIAAEVMRRKLLAQHPMKNVTTKVVGARENTELSVIEDSPEPGDLLLLCADGLHGMQANPGSWTVIRNSGGNLEQAVAALIESANACGGKDNITAIS
jgi:protein phosphatase